MLWKNRQFSIFSPFLLYFFIFLVKPVFDLIRKENVNMRFPGGGTQDIRIRGDQSKKFSGNPKISLQLQCNPKISAHFTYINLYMNIKYAQTMQIEVRIASIEPRNINITMFGIKKYHQHSFSFSWTKKYHFWQHSDPKISDLPPRMCMCRVPPPPWDEIEQMADSGKQTEVASGSNNCRKDNKK